MSIQVCIQSCNNVAVRHNNLNCPTANSLCIHFVLLLHFIFLFCCCLHHFVFIKTTRQPFQAHYIKMQPDLPTVGDIDISKKASSGIHEPEIFGLWTSQDSLWEVRSVQCSKRTRLYMQPGSSFCLKKAINQQYLYTTVQ